MRLLFAVALAASLPGAAIGQTAPDPSPAPTLVEVGPMPKSDEAVSSLIGAMRTYSRDTCGIAILLRADPAAFPNATYPSPQALAQQMGTYFADTFSLSTRIYLSDRSPGPVIAMAHIDGHLFARAREFQNFNLREFTEMGPNLAVAHHSIKATKRALFEELSAQNRDLVGLIKERITVSERLRDLAEVQLLLLNVAPEEVRLSDAARANPRNDVERHMASYLDAKAEIDRFSAELATEEADLKTSEAAVARSTCTFPSQEALYGSEQILTLKDRVAAETDRPADRVSQGDIMRWIVETGFGTPVFDK